MRQKGALSRADLSPEETGQLENCGGGLCWLVLLEK